MSLISHMQMKAVVVVHIDKLLYYHPELNYVVIESMESTSWQLDHDKTLDGDDYFLREVTMSNSIIDMGDTLGPGLEDLKFLRGIHARL